MKTLFGTKTAITDSVLASIAHMPTASLPVLMDEQFGRRLGDADFRSLEDCLHGYALS